MYLYALLFLSVLMMNRRKKDKKTSYDFSKTRVGDVIKFGTYEQETKNVGGNYAAFYKSPIEWIVLEKSGDKMLLSKYGLDCQVYNSESSDVTWESCTIRRWLIEELYNTAFNKTEKQLIKESLIINDDNPKYGTAGGKDTKDKVFLLSISDTENTRYGFGSDEYSCDKNGMCVPTEYAVAKGARQVNGTEAEGVTADMIGKCWWWLRSPGISGYYAALMKGNGHVNGNGSSVCSDAYAVRPAMYINLKS